MPVSRPAISQHLRVLKDAGLVTDRPAGTRRVYAVDPGGLAELRRYLEAFWAEALSRFTAFAEGPDAGPARCRPPRLPRPSSRYASQPASAAASTTPSNCSPATRLPGGRSTASASTRPARARSTSTPSRAAGSTNATKTGTSSRSETSFGGNPPHVSPSPGSTTTGPRRPRSTSSSPPSKPRLPAWNWNTGRGNASDHWAGKTATDTPTAGPRFSAATRRWPELHDKRRPARQRITG